MSTRERLLAVFEALGAYGIAASPARGTGDVARTRAELRAAILARYPRAAGSYIFWTAADDRRFGPDGELHGSLRLHVSGPDVVRAARALLAREGLLALPNADGTALQLAAPVEARAA